MTGPKIAQRIVGRLLANRKPVVIGRVSRKTKNAWLDSSFPAQQFLIARQQLVVHENGGSIPEFEALLTALGRCNEIKDFTSVLEVGCSSGYYKSVIEKRFSSVTYLGTDFSLPFLELGQSEFPGLVATVGDTQFLPFQGRSCDVVISGCVLLHVEDWKQGLRETARVSREFVLLHRTPVSGGVTTLFTKRAYGRKMIEWTFNEAELLAEMAKHQFALVDKAMVYPESRLSMSPKEPCQITYSFQREHVKP